MLTSLRGFQFIYSFDLPGEGNSMNPLCKLRALGLSALVFAFGVGNAWAAPTVAITAPANGGVYLAPASVTVQASAAAESGRTVARVDFFVNGALAGSDPTAAYRVVFSASPGSYNLTAKAIDSAGEETISAPRTITVNAANSAPTVSLSQPPNNARYNIPVDLTLAVSVHAPEVNDHVTRVEYFLNGASAGVVTASPWRLVLPNISPGTYALTATATDAQGASTTSSSRSFTVQATNTPPTVNITSPANNSHYNGPAPADVPVKINADAPETNDAIQRVELFQNGTLVATLTSSPYTATLSHLLPGTYVLTAVATDAQGAQTTSVPRTVIVDTVNRPPTVSLTAPANNTSVQLPASIAVSANANAGEVNGSITQVEFLVNDEPIAADPDKPYSVTWTPTQAGSFQLRARATDNLGAITTSALRTITLTSSNQAPSVSLTSPAANAAFSAPANIPLSADASDDGSIAQVEFFYGSTLIAVRTGAPYAFTWTGVPQGAYSVTARATDNLGIVTTSAAISITVNAHVAKMYFVHTDHLNTPRLITDDQQREVWRWDQQEPFGVTVPNENPSGLGTFEFPLRFRGQYADKETGDFYNYFRTFDPPTGRYKQSDPVGLSAGLNTYSYVDNNPLQGVDPLGLVKGGKGKWVECSDEDWSYCRDVCGSRGVKSCRHFWQVHTELIGGEVVRGWKPALYPSCNCNESCDAACKTTLVMIGLGIAICAAQPEFIPLFLMGGAATGAASR
jgi:RHS repeat-associated protein